MSHEYTVTDEYNGMLCLRPSRGKYSNANASSYINCIAEFDNLDEAEEFAHKWSHASGSKRVRHFLLEKHEMDHPEYSRISGPLRENYINYYHGEAEKLQKEE